MNKMSAMRSFVNRQLRGLSFSTVYSLSIISLAAAQPHPVASASVLLVHIHSVLIPPFPFLEC